MAYILWIRSGDLLGIKPCLVPDDNLTSDAVDRALMAERGFPLQDRDEICLLQGVSEHCLPDSLEPYRTKRGTSRLPERCKKDGIDQPDLSCGELLPCPHHGEPDPEQLTDTEFQAARLIGQARSLLNFADSKWMPAPSQDLRGWKKDVEEWLEEAKRWPGPEKDWDEEVMGG